MTQTTAQRREAAIELAKRMFSPSILATLNWNDLSAAIGAIDDTMDKLPALLNSTLTVKQNLVAALPEPFKSTSTATQKAIALMVWAMKETGII